MTATRKPTAAARDYAAIAARNSGRRGSRQERLEALTDDLWAVLSPTGVSWIGFYFGPGARLDDGRVVGADEMLLGPCRDRPACSPIGLHGVCGRGWRERRSVIVRDVAALGPEYVACDPRDASEVVVPLLDEAGGRLGVLDADSFEVGAFDERDALELQRILASAGLTTMGHDAVIVL